MATHKVTIEVTDEELEELEAVGFFRGANPLHSWVSSPSRIIQRVLNAAPEPKRYLQVGDKVTNGGEVVFVSPHYVIVRYGNFEMHYGRNIQDQEETTFLLEDYSIAYFPELPE